MHLETEEFLSYLSEDKGFSRNTIAAYQNDLAQFASFVAGQPGEAVSRDTVLSYMLHLKEKRYAATTVARKIAAIRSYFHYMVGKGHFAVDPTEDLESPRIGRTLPKAASVEDVDLLLRAAAEQETPEALRDRAMLELLYATGLRVSELVSLNLDDVNVEAGYVRCVGRSGKERVIPVDYSRMQSVANYLQNARGLLARAHEQDALFLNHRGARLTRQGFWLIIKGYARKAGLDESITPHTLRHSFAAHQLRNGADLKDLKEIMGHASISSTQVYAQINPDRTRKEWEKAHPLS